MTSDEAPPGGGAFGTPGANESGRVALPERRSDGGRPRLRGLRGPWRVAVREGSMLPGIAPGDWLLVDPLVRDWPRRGTLVVIREPDTDSLALKRVAGRPGDRIPFADGFLHLGPGEAWLRSDADEATTAAAGYGPPIDSRRYGPISIERLVARAWFRYGPPRRMGRLPRDPGVARGSGDTTRPL